LGLGCGLRGGGCGPGGHTSIVRSLHSVLPDASVLLTGGEDGRVSSWLRGPAPPVAVHGAGVGAGGGGGAGVGAGAGAGSPAVRGALLAAKPDLNHFGRMPLG
jgi:hypothetical protein